MALNPAHLQWSEDGSLHSRDFGDIYFQPQQGPAESYYVFLEQNHLPARFSSAENFSIAELGFGSGLNFLLTAQLWDKSPTSGSLFYASIEKHPISREDLTRIFSFWPELQNYTQPLLEQYPPLIEGFHHLHFLKSRIQLMLLFGDVTDRLPELRGNFDAWYLDGFAPAKNPAMWEDKLFPLIAARTKPEGTLTSFSAAGAVRRGLQSAGFTVEKAKGFGAKRHMTVAQMPKYPHPNLLPEGEGIIRVPLHPLPLGEGRGEGTSPSKKNIAVPGAAKRAKIIVLGAGIAGACAAFALAQKGYAVTVIDRQPAAAGETSGNPVGIVYPKLTVDPSPMGALHSHGFCFTRSLALALRLPSWTPCSVTHLDISEQARARHLKLAAQDYPAEFLKYEAGKGLHLPAAGYLSPPEFCRRLLAHPNITTRYSTDIQSLDELDYDTIVIALGHGSKNFRETDWLPLQPLRGQITALRPTLQSEKISGVFCHDGFLTPAIDGLHYSGATFQKEEPASPEIRSADHAENLQKLEQYLPGLGFSQESIAGGRTGYRTTTPDKLPVIGACPDYSAFIESPPAGKFIAGESPRGFHERIYLSTGFGAHGLTTAPLAGAIIASLIAGDPLPVPQSLLASVAPERFILRGLKRRKV